MAEDHKKQTMWLIASVLGAITALGTIHAKFIVPGIMVEVRDEIHRHIGEFKTERDRYADRELARIERRLEILEKRLER